MKQTVKTFAQAAAAVLALPVHLHYAVHVLTVGRDRAFAAVCQRAARWPGVTGEYRRRALLSRLIARMGRDVVISFGSVLSRPTIEISDGVYVGVYCVLGDVRIGENTIIADHVCIPSGPRDHGLARLDAPVKDQPGDPRPVRIGADCWIGAAAVILADVGDHAVVGAGSVVTRPVEDYQIVAGNPARPIGDRRDRAKGAPA